MGDGEGLWDGALHERFEFAALAHLHLVVVHSHPELAILLLTQEVWRVHLHQVVGCGDSGDGKEEKR